MVRKKDAKNCRMKENESRHKVNKHEKPERNKTVITMYKTWSDTFNDGVSGPHVLLLWK